MLIPFEKVWFVKKFFLGKLKVIKNSAILGKYVFHSGPGLKPTLYTVAVLSLLNSFKVFREAYLVAGDYPDKSMYLLQHLFNNWFRELNFSKMAAASVLMAVIIFILIVIADESIQST